MMITVTLVTAACGGTTASTGEPGTTAPATTEAGPTTTASAEDPTTVPAPNVEDSTTTTAAAVTTDMVAAYEAAVTVALAWRPGASFVEAFAVAPFAPDALYWEFTFADPADGAVAIVSGTVADGMDISQTESWSENFFTWEFGKFDLPGLQVPFDPTTLPIGAVTAAQLAADAHVARGGLEITGTSSWLFAEDGRTYERFPIARQWEINLAVNTEWGVATYLVDADTGEVTASADADVDTVVPVIEHLAAAWGDDAHVVDIEVLTRMGDPFDLEGAGWAGHIVDRNDGLGAFAGGSMFGLEITGEKPWADFWFPLGGEMSPANLDLIATPVDLAGVAIGYFDAVEIASMAFEDAFGHRPTGNTSATLYAFDRWPAGHRWQPGGTQWMLQFLDESVGLAQFWIDAETGAVELDQD